MFQTQLERQEICLSVGRRDLLWVRLEDARQCILVLIGATVDGKKEVLGIADGYRESEESWKELLLGLKQRGLTI